MEFLQKAVMNRKLEVLNSHTQAYHDELNNLLAKHKEEHIRNDPFFKAAKLGRDDIIRAIIEHDPANLVAVTERTDEDGFSAIHRAAASGHVNVVSLLLEKNPGLWRKKDKRGLTPLHHAISNSSNSPDSSIPVIEVILQTDLGAIADVTHKGETCLHIAVKQGGLQRFNLLLDMLRDEDRDMVNKTDNEGNCILHIAVSYKRDKILNRMIGMGYGRLDINIENADGLTALNLCDRGEKNIFIKDCLRGEGARKTVSFIAFIDPFRHATTTELQVILGPPVGLVMAAATPLGNNLDGGAAQTAEKKGVPILDVLTFRDHYSSLKFYWTLSVTIMFVFSIFILGLCSWYSSTGWPLLFLLAFLVFFYGLILFNSLSSFGVVCGSFTIPSIFIVGVGVLLFFVALTLYLLLARPGQRLIRYLRTTPVPSTSSREEQATGLENNGPSLV